jgi:hypothetical protein
MLVATAPPVAFAKSAAALAFSEIPRAASTCLALSVTTAAPALAALGQFGFAYIGNPELLINFIEFALDCFGCLLYRSAKTMLLVVVLSRVDSVGTQT